MHVLLHPAYFGHITSYGVFVQAESVTFEVCDNFQKQSYRTRTKIATATGILQLNIPIIHRKNANGHQRASDVLIENAFHWQRDHWRSIKVAYQTSPFFEYYEDQLYPLYHTPYEKLLDFLFDCHQVVMDCLQLEKPFTKTITYEKEPTQNDFRFLIQAKKERVAVLENYHQLFADRHDFLPNLSILDLLCNEGTAALTYLEKVSLDF